MTSRLVLLRWISLGLTLITLAWVAFAPLKTSLSGATFRAFISRSGFSFWCRPHWASRWWSRWHGSCRPRAAATGLRPVAVGLHRAGGRGRGLAYRRRFSVGVGLLAARFLGQPVATIDLAVQRDEARTALLDDAGASFARRAAAVTPMPR